MVRRAARVPAVDDDDAFDHAGENGRHARPVARQLAEPRPELLDRPVQRPRHRAQLVVAVVDRRRRQVALAILASTWPIARRSIEP